MGSAPHLTGAPNVPLGTLIEDRYEIVDVLGSGGFATVYRARQIHVDREVAVKVLDALGRGDAEKVERFQREAQIAAQIDHPNIVTIYDTGVIESSNQPYIVMELLAGETLRDEVRLNGAMTPQRCLPLFLDCLDGLDHAHERKIVHKDLKPSNLFLNHPGQRRERLRIVDFGVARILTNDTAHVTLTGNIFGTPRYFAPEYIQRQLVTPALDVYQMGLILVEALTGAPVVDVDNPLECIRIHGSGEIKIPTSLVDGPLGEILVRALAVDHRERFANAGEFCEALGRVDPASVATVVKGESKSLISDLSGGLRALSPHTPEPSKAPLLVRHGDEHDAVTKVAVAALSGIGGDPDIDWADDSGQIDVVSISDISSETAFQPEAPPEETYHGPSLKPFVVAVVLLTLLLLLGVIGIIIKVVATDNGSESGAEPGRETEDRVGFVDPETEDGVELVDEGMDVGGGGLATAGVDLLDAGVDTDGDADRSDVVDQMGDLEVEVATRPSGARLILDGQHIGMSPYAFQFASADDPEFEVRIEMPGYKTARVTVGPAFAPRIVVPLTRRARVPWTGRKPKGKPAMKVVP